MYEDYISRGFEQNVGMNNVKYMISTAYENNLVKERFGENRQAGVTDLDKFDLIVFSYYSWFDDRLADVLNSNTSATKIYIDNEDNFFIKGIANHSEIKYYFKRELYKKFDPIYIAEWTLRYLYGGYLVTYKRNRSRQKIKYFLNPLFQPCRYSVEGSHEKLKPLSLAYNPTFKRPPSVSKNREYDVTMVANRQNIKERWQVSDQLLQIKNEFTNNNILFSDGGYNKEEYLKILADSKSSVSVRGYGCDTFRYWEIAYNGAMLISQKLPIIIPDDFIEGESALFFTQPTELREKFKKYVVDSDEWKEVAKNGQRRYLKYHTPKARVKNQILKYLK